MTTTSNPSAFPLNTENTANPGAFDPEPGMTLRDWFAGQALVGLISNANNKGTPEGVSDLSYTIADAMLAERAKGGPA